MTLTELKETIFGSGNVDSNWEENEPGIIAQIEAEAEFLTGELIDSGEMNESERKSLISQLMESYK